MAASVLLDKHFHQQAFLLLGQGFRDCQPKRTLGTRSLGKASQYLLAWVGLASFAFGCPWVNCCFPFGFLDSPREQKTCAGEERKFKLLKKKKKPWSYLHSIFFSICICRWSQEPMKRVCVLELLTQWGKGRWGFLAGLRSGKLPCFQFPARDEDWGRGVRTESPSKELWPSSTPPGNSYVLLRGCGSAYMGL